METASLSPIIIASPVRRSGTTLMQRLLCSSTNTLIYGESCANDFSIFANLLANKEMIFMQSKNWLNQQLDEVLDGSGLNNWIPDLMPDIEGYIAAYKASIVSLFHYCETFAQQNGRSSWGMKMAEWNPTSLMLIRKIFPGTKIIYLHRDIGDCVRSAKKADMLKGEQEIRQFCQTWKQFSDYARMHLTDKMVMHLEYDDLVEFPEKWLAAIESFTGAAQIDRRIMEVKTNTYADDHKLEKGAGAYLEPAVLTSEELGIIESYVCTKVLA